MRWCKVNIHKILPLAVTMSDDKNACVAGINKHKDWIRPGPIDCEHIENALYSYQYWNQLTLIKDDSISARPEDHIIKSVSEDNHEAVTEKSKLQLIKVIEDDCAIDSFSKNRSVGIINVNVHNLYWKRSTGGRRFLRLCFTDSTLESFDWIVPELRIGEYADQFKIKESNEITPLLQNLKSTEVYLTIGLTKPNNRFPGKFRGCHPLIVGVHTFPDYQLMRL